MRRAAATIAAAMAWTACSVAGPAVPMSIEAGKPFLLKAGEFAQTADGSLRIGFDAVKSDSRCPRNVQCVWAGEATVRIWVQQGSGAREPHELRSAPNTPPALRVRDQSLRLLRLEPYPVAGKLTATSDYTATLNLDRDSAPEPER